MLLELTQAILALIQLYQLEAISRLRPISLIKEVIILMFELFRRFKHNAKLLLLGVRIDRLTRPDEIPRRVELCREALKLVEHDPELQAMCHIQLADSLCQNPLGSRADNLEEAISHYKLALQVYTRQTTRQEWAMTQNNLAIAYSKRIRGERADNLEEAIFHAKQSLTVYTRQVAPQEWGMTIYNLANAYSNRIRGKPADNLEEAIKHYKLALQVRTRQAAPEKWAMTMNGLATAYLDRIRGDRADNLEEAISHYQLALQVYTRQAAPFDWAMTINGLANAYSERIRGSKANNLEEAIRNYKLILQVCTRQAAPQEWALACNNLGIAYFDRIFGERADNLEEAIHHYKLVLQVCTRQAAPFDWAITINNLATAYGRRIRGERADNHEEAIEYFKLALTVYTREAAPQEWATTIYNLGLVYSDRIRGEQADNQEKAISYYKQALQVYTRQATPLDWAMTMNNLANAYRSRIRGDKADNLELAISYFKQSLQVRTCQAAPLDWAMTINNLAIAYSDRIKGERADNLEEAISHCKLALTVRTRQVAPLRWAATMNNLGGVYESRIRGEQANNLEEAIFHYKQSLTVRTRQADPYKWAQTMNNLAIVYCLRIRGERADNLETAISHYKLVLEVWTPYGFPSHSRVTAYRLGCLWYDKGRINLAREAFVTAHEAAETLRGEMQRQGTRRELALNNADLYARLVFCCLHDANADEKAAFEYAAAGKGRAFVDLLASTRFNLSEMAAKDEAFAKDWQPYQEIRQEIDNLRNFAQRAPRGEQSIIREKTNQKRNPKEVRAQLQKELLAKQKEARELWEELTYNYPALTATQSAPSLSLAQAQQVATELDATLVEYFYHTGGWCAFVVTKDELRHVPLEGMNEEFWQEMVEEWFNKLDNPRFHTDESYYALEEWYDVLIAPLALPKKGRLLLAPTYDLHLMPLAIARHPENGSYLYEQYDLTFAPNLSMVRVTLAEAKKATPTTTGTLLTVAYPGRPEWQTSDDEKVRKRYLEAVIPEAEAVASRFSQPTKLYNQQATPEAVIKHAPQKEVVHFSCHAGFERDHPTESGFELFEGYLTVQQIITQLRLKETRLATLSACQTHRASASAGDELTGLTQALMVAGAKSIVASLWSVDQDSTRALFEVFYQAIANGEAPTIALKQAMQHVRQQPGWEHPFYWAAFQVSGLGF